MISLNMDIPPLFGSYVLLTAASLLFFFFVWRKERKTRLPLPPGPPGWPIVGNLFQVGRRPHESFHALSMKYGPLMTLHLGMKTTVVVSSPAMAKEIFKTHDHIFSGRMKLQGNQSHSTFHKYSLTWADCGPYWRNLRRISTLELFSSNRLEALKHLRRAQLSRTIRLIFEEKGKVVNIAEKVFMSSLNLLGNMIFSTDIFTSHGPESVALKDHFLGLMKIATKPNLADFFPFLQFLDPQGVSRDMIKHMQALYDIFSSFIDKRLTAISQHDKSEKDFLDVLLDSRAEDFTLYGVRALILELFIAGTESTTTTIEWAMTHFIRNPQKLNRACQELDQVIGCNRKVEESDLDRLPYLNAAVKETFRMGASSPLLLPHRATSTCEIGGFVIPKDTQVLVNVWAMGRDPTIWKNPLEFTPERFLEDENSKMGYGGQNFELIPFGAGRRMCPGLPLASRIVHFVLASLLHSFDWKFPGKEMDMSNQFGIALKKAVDLKVIPMPRLPDHIY